VKEPDGLSFVMFDSLCLFFVSSYLIRRFVTRLRLRCWRELQSDWMRSQLMPTSFV